MRASVMMFLPALSRGGHIASLASQLSKLGLALRGLFGEGSGSAGCMYQISNQITLGVSESEILSKLTEAYLTTQLERGFSTLDFYKSLLI